ncbi:hypothetical protein LRR81_09885 [Metabacillus sp. GX 13764]|uniref:hypothetical protein n=1 Tax=Metabacillus kandeliae TaxID=2900151 RepID=UPI001E59709F|nr:hypothetical protein [Metabacillus kandeliae]MCD7034549.1 hypothetical protein [Metabacillus kandeliae]
MKKRLSFLIFACIVLLFTSGVSADTVSAAKKSKRVDATSYVDTNFTLIKNYMGIGVQWDPHEWYDLSKEDWKTLTSRVDYLKPAFLRVMFRAYWYTEGYDKNGRPIYNWNTKRMQKLYKLLDYAKKKDIPVLLGQWDDPAANSDRDSSLDHLRQYNIQEDDPRWAKLIGDSLNHLINKKGYTNIKYFNYVNEPNGDWSFSADYDKWSKGIGYLHDELEKQGLSRKVKISGPDNSGQNEWITKSVNQLSDKIGIYDTHWYANADQIQNGEIEKVMAPFRSYITANDPNGKNKQFFFGEAGVFTGRTNGDQQPNVKEYWYGVSMADFTVQSMRAGMSGITGWDLEDSMHINNGFEGVSGDNYPTPPGPGTLKVWGMWNALGAEMGNPDDEKLRPWFYTWSLLSRNFPKGSKIVRTTETGLEGVRTTAAIIPHGKKSDMSLVVVNNSDKPRTIKVMVPTAASSARFSQYNYFENDRPTNSKGFPVPEKTNLKANLKKGIDVKLPSKGMVLLTTLDGGKAIHLKGNR